jgi:malonyl-CoA/methylmalonyl-CoA synthetase
MDSVNELNSTQLNIFVGSVSQNLELFSRAVKHAQEGRVAIISNGRQYTYNDLLQDSFRIASILSPRFLSSCVCEKLIFTCLFFTHLLYSLCRDLCEERVAFLTPPNYQYVMVQWAVWRAGGIAVPLCK